MKLSELNSDLLDSNISNVLKKNLNKLGIEQLKNLIVSCGNDIKIELRQPDGKNMPITILLWRNTVNIYLGTNFAHYAEDIFVRSKKDAKELDEQLYKLLSLDIREVTCKNNNSDYAFYAKDGSWKWDLNFKNRKGDIYIEKVYESWIKE